MGIVTVLWTWWLGEVSREAVANGARGEPPVQAAAVNGLDSSEPLDAALSILASGQMARRLVLVGYKESDLS